MKRLVTTLTPTIFTSLLVIAIVVCAGSPAAAQADRGTGPAVGRPSPNGTLQPVESARTPSIRERQYKLIEMEREAAKVRTPEQEKLALAQIAEDYEKIQIINNKMMSSTMRAAAPDYRSVADTMAEIKTRAVRMRENLRLAKTMVNEDEKRPAYKKADDAAGFKANLLLLDRSIMSFVGNPIFKNPSVIELEQAVKASSDLQMIVEFSQSIAKDAQRLGKASAKQ